MNDLTILVPSRGRPDNAKRLIEAFHKTRITDSELVFVLDEDDPMLEFYPMPTSDTLVDVYMVPEWMPMVHKLNLAAKDITGEHGPFALAFMGDDHLPRTPEWDSLILDQLMSMETGYVYPDDGFQHERMATSWFVTSNIVQAIGMVPAPVDHLFCDNSVMDVGRGAGCLRYLGDVLVEHMHPMALKADWDAQYRRVNSDVQEREDRRKYKEWRDRHLAGAVETVRGLRDGE